MSVLIQQCRSCRTELFPARLFCPVCGNDGFSDVYQDQATIEETTMLASGGILATLRFDSGLRVIARLTGTETARGQRVALTNDPYGADSAAAFVPNPSYLKEDQP
ncbi:zinc ribbon domain-containing protein [Paenarthrobacter sp. NPDC057981]|uniref:zinc ribbon domain-containing protein n=1 Tax=Paenarthrobacter sp. NPDC057981 TaxID=3346297 RepID=UPI0036DC7693